MPVIKSAIKKLRQDKRRTAVNNRVRKNVEIVLAKAKKETKDFKVIASAYSEIDKAAKKGLLHKNKASRMKAMLAKKVKPSKLTTKSAKVPTTTKKKSATKSA